VKADKTKQKELIKSLAIDLNSSKKSHFIEGISKVPVSGKVFDENDFEALISACAEGWITEGEFTSNFEKGISEYLDIRHSIFVNSGSSANLLALAALKILNQIEDGSEIITCAVGFPTTLNPIIQNNLVPVLVDIDLDTLNINTDLIEENISKKTKGIVIAHTLGIPFDIDRIKKICKQYDLFLMEDNCDALGSKYNNQFTGTFGDVSTLSFYPAHHITTGEGGMVLTNNPKLKKIIKSLRDWGRDCYCPSGVDNTCKKRFEWELGGLPYGYDHKYIYSTIGYNLKATDIQASLGISQLQKLDSFIRKRKQNYEYLNEKFLMFEDYFKFVKINEKQDPSWFGFPLIIKDKSLDRRELLLHYEQNLIGTRLLFGGNITKQPAYENIAFKTKGNLENSNIITENFFWLGIFPGLSFEMLDYVTIQTAEFLAKK
jgi:CDP-4-dehydro-6-deoxyglucose reductase, E1